jgi:uncharacterized protein (TIGR02391 family)
MNLQTSISKSLWESINTTYVSGNYSHTILDAIHHLSNVIREKSGCDGDGAQLIGQVFGGDSPRLKINKFQTQSEKDEQKGIENILRGLYIGIRNPRSHEKIDDSQLTADSIICFIDYLVLLIDNSEEPFVISNFLKRVFDPDFVDDERYIRLLVNEIPSIRLFDTLIALYRGKSSGNVYHVGKVIKELLTRISVDQTKQFLTILANELNTISDETEIRYNLYIIPISLWMQIQEAPRIRIENRVIKAIEKGTEDFDQIRDGALATWARELFPFFILKEKAGDAFITKLESDNLFEENYVLCFFFRQLPIVITNERKIKRCTEIISNKIKHNQSDYRVALINNITYLPNNWQILFKEKLIDETNEKNPAVFLSDGSPFLTNLVNLDDENPF